jgi:hypothetical protein
MNAVAATSVKSVTNKPSINRIHKWWVQYNHNKKVKNTFMQTNNIDILTPFLHGANIHRYVVLFGQYVFLPRTDKYEGLLLDRGFMEYDKAELSTYDNIMSLSDKILHHKNFNLTILLIDTSIWELVVSGVQVAKKSSKVLNTQASIIVNIVSELQQLLK